MGGSSNPIKKITKPIKKVAKKVTAQVKRTRAEDVLSGGTTLIGRKIHEKTGIKGLDTAFNPIGKIMGEVGEKFIDKPKAAKEEFKRQEAAAAENQKRQLSELRGRRAQEKAEAGAAEALEKGRRRQKKRKQSGGRKSTILTNKLGGTGGVSGQDKTNILGG